jgi:hypothetical protein
MLDRINEMIEMFLVGLGLHLSRFSDEEMSMITVLLALLMLAAAATGVLRATHPWH